MSAPPEARLAEILDALQLGVVAVDRNGSVEFQNGEASRILGVSASVTLGRPLAYFLGPEHPVTALLAEVFATGREVASSAMALPEPLPERRGSAGPVVDLTGSPVGGGSEPEGAVLTLRDRTIGLELQALVAQRTQDEQFAKLAKGIAHEVRNPLGGIRGSAELLLRKLDDASLHRYPELIRDETDRIRRLLDDLSEITSTGELALAQVNLHQVLDALLELQAQDADWGDVEVVREYDPSIPEIECDRDRLAQVLLNLVRNAVQAMNGKGRLLLRSRIGSELVAPGGLRPARMVHIDICDTGPGIPEEDLPHIFTPFFTRRDSGTGLGLAIAQHWVVCHGGRLHVASAPGGGTRMRVVLPVRRDR